MHLTAEELAAIEKQARIELHDDAFRILVDARKLQIVEHEAGRRWWHRLIPFTVSVSIQRRNYV